MRNAEQVFQAAMDNLLSLHLQAEGDYEVNEAAKDHYVGQLWNEAAQTDTGANELLAYVNYESPALIAITRLMCAKDAATDTPIERALRNLLTDAADVYAEAMVQADKDQRWEDAA